MPFTPSVAARQTKPFAFFLGGSDLEMLAIGELLAKHTPQAPLHDHGLRWGARASAYAEEIMAALAQQQVPVLVELQPDLELPATCIWIDHHGDQAGVEAPSALEQVVTLLDLPPSVWSRRWQLIAANDRGYIAAMQQLGATTEEMQAIRAEDRQAQGIDAAQEKAALAAIARAEKRCGGRLTVVRLPHPHSAAVVDRLERGLGGPGYEVLLVLTPQGPNLFGPGAIIEHMKTQFPHGWWGGGLPVSGYWGASEGSDEVLHELQKILCS